MKKKIYGKPSLSVNAVYVERFPVNPLQIKTGELTATINLGVNF
jgi:hypothetical protein